MAVDGEVFLCVYIVKVGLIRLLRWRGSGGVVFVLLKPVAVLLCGTYANGVEAPEAVVAGNDTVIEFHAGNDGEVKLGREILEIVDDEAEIEESELASVEETGEVVEIADVGNVVVEEIPEEEPILQIVENMPEFPGGMPALMKYLRDNINYPRISREMNSQGRAFINFVVNSDGSIQDVEVLKSSSDPNLDKEAVRVVSAMPKWNPGRQAGKAVRVRFTLPVTFKLK